MIKRNLSLIFVALLLCSSSQNILAYEFKDSSSKEIQALLEDSLKNQKKKNLEWWQLHIHEINGKFYKLSRSDTPIEDLIELKYNLQHWRKKTSEFLISHSKGLSAKDYLKVSDHLNTLDITVNEESLKTFVNNLPINPKDGSLNLQIYQNLALFIANQGNPEYENGILSRMAYKPALLRSGPNKFADIKPIKASDWPFEKWSDDSEFSDYDFVRDGIIFRGKYFKSGDILLVNLNEKADGTFSCFTEPRPYFSHFAFFVIIHKNDLKFPAVIEIHEHGVRAVPLNVFLSPAFTSYVEIYRFKDKPDDWNTILSDKMQEILEEEYAYGFYPDEENRKYLTCASTGTLCLEKLEMKPISGNSSVSEQAAENFKILGLQLNTVLTPTDYMRDPRLKFVGLVDNGQFESNIVRELILKGVREILNKQTLDEAQFPYEYSINLWGIQQIQKDSYAGGVFRYFEGFSKNNFPKGPSKLLALVEIFEGYVKTAEDNSMESLLGLMEPDVFSYHDIEENERVKDTVLQELQPIDVWFK